MTASLVARGENAEVRLAEISHEMNLNPPVSDITDANAELRLVTAARLQGIGQVAPAAAGLDGDAGD